MPWSRKRGRILKVLVFFWWGGHMFFLNMALILSEIVGLKHKDYPYLLMQPLDIFY